jgi:hypothetical protein
MSYFAEIVDGVVTNVIVADQKFINSIEGNWVETFDDASARYNYAVIGGIYDPIDDAFIAPMPKCGHEELLLNDLKRWECSNDEHQAKII